jgi:hypothetical protein
LEKEYALKSGVKLKYKDLDNYDLPPEDVIPLVFSTYGAMPMYDVEVLAYDALYDQW